MCKAIDDLIKDGERKGERKGKREGALKAIEILYKLNLPFKQIVSSITDSFGYSEKKVIKDIHSLYPDFS